MEGLIMGFQESAGMAVSNELTCMANKLDKAKVKARLQNGFTYGQYNRYYEPSQQLTTLGNEIAKAADSCVSFWDSLWADVKEVSQVVLKVANFVCKYQGPIMEGVELVSTAAANPEIGGAIDELIEEGCLIDEGYNIAKDAIQTINDGIDCTQVVYDTEQYVESYLSTKYQYNKEDGEFAGKLYHAVKECKTFYDDAKKLSGSVKSLSSSLIALPHNESKVA